MLIKNIHDNIRNNSKIVFKTSKFFKKMAEYIGTKTKTQCKSKFQKQSKVIYTHFL